jgi:hypothetical protein
MCPMCRRPYFENFLLLRYPIFFGIQGVPKALLLYP